MCELMWAFSPNALLQIWHLKSCLFSCTFSMCLSIFDFRLNFLLQKIHWKFCWFWCTVLMCALRSPFLPNDLLQTGQSKTCFSSVCSILCPCKQFFSAYVNLQYDEICVRMQPASSHHPASLTCSICWWELFNFQTSANLNQISEITICFDDRTITLCAVVGNTGWHGMAKSER